MPAGVDIKVNRFGVVIGVEIQHGRHDGVGQGVTDRLPQKNNPLLVEAGIEVNPLGILASRQTIGNFGGTDRHGACLLLSL